MVAVLSLRFATRLPGRRPGSRRRSRDGSALALGGIDVAEAPPVSGLVLVFASAFGYSVWTILSARLSGERRDRLAGDSRGRVPGRRRRRDHELMMSATAAVYAAAGAGDGSTARSGDGAVRRVAGDPGRGLVASFLAIQTFYAGARRIGAARAALTATVEPLIIVILAGSSWTRPWRRSSWSARD